MSIANCARSEENSHPPQFLDTNPDLADIVQERWQSSVLGQRGRLGYSCRDARSPSGLYPVAGCRGSATQGQGLAGRSGSTRISAKSGDQMAKRKFAPRQKLFIQEFPVDMNATQAAIRAGYSKKTARAQGHRLLTDADIRAAIVKKVKERADRTEVTADQVVTELALIAFSDMGNYVRLTDDGGVVLDWAEMPEGGTRVVSEITQERFWDGEGENARPVRKTKFKLYDKLAALNGLAKHLGMYIERRELSGPDGKPIQIEDAETYNAKERQQRTEAILDIGRARRTKRA